jgi:drug/metabolite transporter (DMT)-like permease
MTENRVGIAPSPPRTPTRAIVVAGMAAMILVWGSTWIVIQVGLRDVPAFTGLLSRFALAAGGFAVLAKYFAAREGGSSPPFRLAFVLGTFNFTGSYCIVYYTEQFIPSSLAALLFATYPLMLAIGAHFAIPGERVTPRSAVGFLLGFAGVALLFVHDIPKLGPEAIAPAALMLGSPLVVMLGTLYVKRHAAGVSSLLLNRDGLVISTIQVALVTAVAEWGADVAWTPSAVASIVYLALFGTVATFGIYFWLMRTAPASFLALTAYLTPAIAVLLGAVFGGEPVSRDTLIGAAFILLGVFLATRRRSAAT